MFETSKDILNIALAIGAFLALGGLALVFIYSAKILRQVYKMMTTVEGAFEAVRKIFETIGEKVADTSAIGKFVVDIVKLIGDVKLVKKEVAKKAKKRKKTSKKSS